CIEAALDVDELRSGLSARARAEEVFSMLRVWDTERNNGVLLYLLLADRDFEIVADRAIARCVGHPQWEAICREVEAKFRADSFKEGVLLGIQRISEQLARHFPPAAHRSDELPDTPVVL